MKLYRTTQGAVVEEDDRFYLLSTLDSTEAWDQLICDPHVRAETMARMSKNR